MTRLGRLSPSNARVVAEAYGYQMRVGSTGVYVMDGNREVAFVYRDGEINPCPPYTKADHECAMAIRATLPIH